MQPEVWNVPGASWRPVHPRLAAVRLINLLATTLPAAALAAVAASWWWGGRFGWLIVVAAVVWVAARGVAVVRSVRVWAFAETGEHLLVRHGVWTRRLSIVPYGRLQYLDITADPVSRMFGLATLVLHTASAATDATIPGLTPREAVGLRDRLTEVSGAGVEGL